MKRLNRKNMNQSDDEFNFKPGHKFTATLYHYKLAKTIHQKFNGVIIKQCDSKDIELLNNCNYKINDINNKIINCLYQVKMDVCIPNGFIIKSFKNDCQHLILHIAIIKKYNPKKTPENIKIKNATKNKEKNKV